MKTSRDLNISNLHWNCEKAAFHGCYQTSHPTLDSKQSNWKGKHLSFSLEEKATSFPQRYKASPGRELQWIRPAKLWSQGGHRGNNSLPCHGVHEEEHPKQGHISLLCLPWAVLYDRSKQPLLVTHTHLSCLTGLTSNPRSNWVLPPLSQKEKKLGCSRMHKTHPEAGARHLLMPAKCPWLSQKSSHLTYKMEL